MVDMSLCGCQVGGVSCGKVTVGLCDRQVGAVSCGKVTVGLCDRQVGAVLCPAVHGQQALLGPPGAAERRRLDGARSRLVRVRRDHDGPAAARACRRLAGRPPRLLSHSPGKLHPPVSPGTCILDLSPFGVRCRDPSVCLSVCLSVCRSQLMPLPLTVSCISKVQTGFTFLVPAHPGSPG